MPNDMEHERHRWSYMSEGKLLTRLGRIRDPVKLTNFINVAVEYGNDRLLSLAAHRAHQLGSTHCEALAERYATEVMRRRTQEQIVQRAGIGLRHNDAERTPRRDQVVRRVQTSVDMRKVNSCYDCGLRTLEMSHRTYEYDEEKGLHYFYCPACWLKRRIAERKISPKQKVRKIRFRRKNEETK